MAATATATGALRRVLLPAIRRRLTTATGQPLISFTDARAGTTKAHQAEVAARRLLRKYASCFPAIGQHFTEKAHM
ncbi:hypothetical protein D1007_16388 [Hordeum vulgare]|nr:hypothetical protein D1007_16388 [Hordeum vulgare]